ncbi:ferric cupric reductase transmembrane component 2 [Fusarium mundagurra]|uniref:Ferric cupric reductase transmembrane component 2 n=1 Tax=Fusarium mundagurra TaxID=1567541 RepID=A0A8H5XU25_9HYPO|nr:ferric cupric reductase transmembrane component 2 [Fusarium mundagurra]
MDFYRTAGIEAMISSASTAVEAQGPDRSHPEVESTSTIAPYYSGVNGINQAQNMLFKKALWWTLGITALVVLTIRMLEIVWAQLRLVSAMSIAGERQGYWRISQWSWMPAAKKHIIYAPLWKKRHSRVFRLSSAISVGTLPSRLHMALLVGYLGSNFTYMFMLNWANDNRYAFCAELRGRSGNLALVNMVPLIVLAGRNNPLIPVLKISFDMCNLLHRWIGRIVVLEVVIHSIAWAIAAVADNGWEYVRRAITGGLFLGSGTLGTVAVVIMLIQSLSYIRYAFYETFLNTHIILATIAFVCTWAHCASASSPGGLPELSWIMAIMVLWFADRLARVIRLAQANWSGRGFTHQAWHARVLTVLGCQLLGEPPILHCLGQPPLQHTSAHLREETSCPLDQANVSTAVSFIVGAQTGMTRKLFIRASQAGRSIRLKAAFEGPYAGHHKLDSYGHAVLFAGSTGITHQLLYIRHLLEGYNAGTVATRRVTLVWIIREYESLEWVRPYMDMILSIPHRKDILCLHVFVTRLRYPRDITNASTTVRMYTGRPNVPALLAKEIEEQVGAMCVTVCGPGGLADDVRGAVCAMQAETVVDFVEESFTW